MKTAARLALYFTTVILLVIISAACSGTGNIGEPPPEAVCSSIINAKCTRCHYKTRICDALGTKSVRQWKKSTIFMVRQGAELTEDEQNKVVACLSSLPQGSPVVCD
jgi:hypothetical protein